MPWTAELQTTGDVLQIGSSAETLFTLQRPDRSAGDSGNGRSLVIRAGSSQTPGTHGDLTLGDLSLNEDVACLRGRGEGL